VPQGLGVYTSGGNHRREECMRKLLKRAIERLAARAGLVVVPT
jgi:hypothetical protein